MTRRLVLLILIFSFTKIIFGQSETYIVKKASFSSDKYDEFSSVYYKNGIVFCSNRLLGLSNHTTSENKGLFKICFIDTTTKAGWGNAKLLSKNLTSILNDGPVTFNKTRDTIYFSRNLDVNGKLSNLSAVRNKLGIFSSVLIDGQWTKVRDLRINNEYYNVTTPCLSPDGKTLYLASDKPGGFGGSDLYSCEWKNGYWNDPVNLGPMINTNGNEAYPFMDQSGKLFFSSDGHPGLGGKDIFLSIKSDTSWIVPVHLDAPINSQYDDFALITDSVMNEGYFSSKRDNTIDIYHFKTNFHQPFNCKNQRINIYCFKFTDESKIPIDESYLQYVWSFDNKEKTIGNSIEHCFKGPGKYSVKLDVVEKNSGRIFFSKLSYNLELKDIEQPIIKSPGSAIAGESIEFDGLSTYFPGSSVLSYSWTFSDGYRTAGEAVKHIFKDKGEYEVRLGLILKNDQTGRIFDACTSKQIKVFTDKQEKKTYDSKSIASPPKPNILEYDHAFIGNMYSLEKEINQDVVFQVEILTSNTRLNPDNSIFNNVPKKYTIRELRAKGENMFSYVIDEEMSLMGTRATYNEIVDLGYKNTKIKPYVLEDPASKELNTLKKVFGVSVDVFFNANEYNLLTAGTQILDQIIGLMAKYPLIKLEVATHTDNLGAPASNTLLSQKRAEAMVNYLISHGVSSLRLVAKGYGSSRPLISNMYEADRKLNRRVEFTIIK